MWSAAASSACCTQGEVGRGTFLGASSRASTRSSGARTRNPATAGSCRHPALPAPWAPLPQEAGDTSARGGGAGVLLDPHQPREASAPRSGRRRANGEEGGRGDARLRAGRAPRAGARRRRRTAGGAVARLLAGGGGDARPFGELEGSPGGGRRGPPQNPPRARPRRSRAGGGGIEGGILTPPRRARLGRRAARLRAARGRRRRGAAGGAAALGGYPAAPRWHRAAAGGLPRSPAAAPCRRGRATPLP